MTRRPSEARRVASAGRSCRSRALRCSWGCGRAGALGLPWSLLRAAGLGAPAPSVGPAAWGAGISPRCRRIVARCRARMRAWSARVWAQQSAPIPREATRHSRATQVPQPWPAASIARGILRTCATPVVDRRCPAPGGLGGLGDAPAWAAPLRDALEASWTALPDKDACTLRRTQERRATHRRAPKAEELSVHSSAPSSRSRVPPPQHPPLTSPTSLTGIGG